MSNVSKRITFISIVGVLILAFVLSLSAQETVKKNIICPQCGYINDISNDFCNNCGTSIKEAKLKAEKKAKEVTVGRPMKKKKPALKIYEHPIDPRRLFVIPVADVLGSMEISMGGGSSFGVKQEEKKPLLGHLSIGLGDVAEVEISTIGIINNLKEGSTQIPTAAFKLKFLQEGKYSPAVAGALRSSLWHTEERDTVKFQKRVATLYFVASKSFGNINIHAGVSISDLRIRTRNTYTDRFISPTHEWAEDNDRDYFNKNLINPFGGLSVQVNPKTMLMLECEWIPEYDFDEKDPIVDKEKIDTHWMVIAGVRFFFFNWLGLDTGVMYRGDYHGIGDAHIEAGVNINLPLPRIFRAMRAK